VFRKSPAKGVGQKVWRCKWEVVNTASMVYLAKNGSKGSPEFEGSLRRQIIGEEGGEAGEIHRRSCKKTGGARGTAKRESQ